MAPIQLLPHPCPGLWQVHTNHGINLHVMPLYEKMVGWNMENLDGTRDSNAKSANE